MSLKPVSKNQSGYIHISMIILVVGITVFILTLSSSLGNPVVQKNPSFPNGEVMGDQLAFSGSDSESSGSSNSESGSSGSKDSSVETNATTGTTIKTETSLREQKTEVKFSEDEKIKTEVREDRTRTDVNSQDIKVRYEVKNGRVIMKAETEDEEDASGEELVKIIDRVDKTGIKVAVAEGRMVVARNGVGALTDFPLQIDLSTNQLIASTSAGTRILTTLPDQAVQNMIRANIISRLGPPAVRQLSLQGELTFINQVVELGVRDGLTVYEISGVKDFKLLGFIPISQPTTAIVSAESGQLIETETTFLARVIDALSP